LQNVEEARKRLGLAAPTPTKGTDSIGLHSMVEGNRDERNG